MISRRASALLLMLALLSGCVSGPSAPPGTPVPTPAVQATSGQPRVVSAPSHRQTPRPRPSPTPPYDGIPERVASTPFPTVVMPPAPAPNFAFTFGYGSCSISRVLDTFQNTLTQYSIGSDPVTVTFRLRELDSAPIYRRMAEINIFAYPEEFTINLPPTMIRLISAPHPRYTLTIRNGPLTRTITWDDAIVRPTTTEADHLRSLIRLLIATIEGHPDVRQLPRLIEVCY